MLDTKNLLDEKSPKWINIFKIFTVVMCCLYILASIIICFSSWFGRAELLFDYRSGLAFFEGLIFLVIGAVAAFAQLSINMLIIQLLNNVQIIREKLEKK